MLLITVYKLDPSKRSADAGWCGVVYNTMNSNALSSCQLSCSPSSRIIIAWTIRFRDNHCHHRTVEVQIESISEVINET